MILKNIKGLNIVSDIAVATDIIEIEFLNEDNSAEFACLSREFDEELACIIDDAVISKESIFDIAADSFEQTEREEYDLLKENAIEAYGPYRKGLPPVELESSKYSKIIQLAEMAIMDVRDEEKLKKFLEEHEGMDVDDIEIIEPPYWMDDLEEVIRIIKNEFYTDDFGNKADEFIEKFEKFLQEGIEKTESESDAGKRLEMSAFLDNNLTYIEDQGMLALDKAIEEFKKF